MLQLKFFFLGALIAGLKGVKAPPPPYWGSPAETFSAGLSPARVDEGYYDNQARAMPVEEDDNELRALPFEEPEARLSLEQALLMDESYIRRRRSSYDIEYDQCFDKKYWDCLDEGKSVQTCANRAKRWCQ